MDNGYSLESCELSTLQFIRIGDKVFKQSLEVDWF